MLRGNPLKMTSAGWGLVAMSTMLSRYLTDEQHRPYSGQLDEDYCLTSNDGSATIEV
jgi:hypothetical protein